MDSKFMKWVILVLNCLIVNVEMEERSLREAGCFVPSSDLNMNHEAPDVYYDGSSDQCPSVQVGLVTWSATDRGVTAKAKCPINKNITKDSEQFYAFWQCDQINRCWNGYPNSEDCSNEIFKVINRYKKQRSTVNVTTELLHATGSKITVEDILLSSKILSELHYSQDSNNIHQTIQNILSISVNLISNKNSDTWADMTRDATIMCASSLMVAMETAVVFALGKMKGEFTFGRVENIFETQLLVKNATKLTQSETIFETQSRSISVFIAKEIVAVTNQDSFVRMTFVAHRSVSNLLSGWLNITKESTRIASDAFSLSVGGVGRNTKLHRPIKFTMALIQDLKPDAVPLCSLWRNTTNDNYGYWSQDGCEVVSSQSNTTHITCQCLNMSIFAIRIKQGKL